MTRSRSETDIRGDFHVLHDVLIPYIRSIIERDPPGCDDDLRAVRLDPSVLDDADWIRDTILPQFRPYVTPDAIRDCASLCDRIMALDRAACRTTPESWIACATHAKAVLYEHD